MIDYFALFERTRRPAVDLDELKQKYHELARAVHSGTQDKAINAIALNEGYRVLADPRLRLRHLLELESIPVQATSVPQPLSDIFLETGTLIQDVDRLLVRSTTTALSKALVNSEVIEKQRLVAHSLAKLRELHATAVHELEALDRRWASANDLGRELSDLASRFAYLAKWIEQLEERALRLSMAN